ncbi:hypothetical protein [Caproicibacter sp.]|uniref:hypothetical protein n=1 Tax=Caproicibacter sp. TaxID=2814884 RepID=UPI003988CC78
MLKTWKKAVSLVLVFALSMMVCVPAFAATNKPTSTKHRVDYTKQHFAELDPNSKIHLNSNFIVYSKAWWIMKSGVGVGAEGWTDLDNKSDGSDVYHYSNIRVWAEEPSSTYWESGRTWGYGRVQVSTGNVGQGALSTYHLYYGTE